MIDLARSAIFCKLSRRRFLFTGVAASLGVPAVAAAAKITS